MGILAWVVSGRSKKTSIQRAIEELACAARVQSARRGLAPKDARLWEMMCDQARDVVHQLVVHNTDARIDWGLKAHRGRVDRPRLVAIYSWILLYQLVLFKSRGLDGYAVAEGFPKLYRCARGFMEGTGPSPGSDPGKAGPWEERWESQVALEAAMGIYNRTFDLLGLYNNVEKRIARVSLFTTATQADYEAMERRIGSEGTEATCGGGCPP